MLRKELNRDFKVVSENGLFLVKRVYTNHERTFSRSATEGGAVSYLSQFTGISEQDVKSEML